jgi:hypothetical protein
LVNGRLGILTFEELRGPIEILGSTKEAPS